MSRPEEVSDSDSDDFVDAVQDFQPLKSPTPLLLVDDVGKEQNEIKNPNSPSRIGANLSLDYLISPEYEKSNTVLAVEQFNQDDCTGTNEAVVQDDHPSTSLQQSNKENPTKKCGPKYTQDKNETEDDRKISSARSNVVSRDVPDCAATVISQYHKESDVSAVESSANREQSKDMPQSSELSPSVEVDTKITESELSEPQLNAAALQQPDLVASIKERPSHLPGVASLKLISGDGGDTISMKTRIFHPSPARPKRPPPPRPKAPPKRPPPPKNVQPAVRLHLNAADDGLLTPNSTVDNITREFAAAFGETSCKDALPKSSDCTLQPFDTSSSTPEFQPLKDQLHVKNEPGKQVKQKDPSSKRRSMDRRLSSTASCNSQLDEDARWSEVTKKTVLRIDSAPGLEILSTVIVRNLDTGQTMPLSMAAEQVSQCLNPLALQIMSRTKEFKCASAGTDEKLTPVRKSPTPIELPPIAIEDDTISVGSDEITIGAEAGSARGLESGKKLRNKSVRLKQLIGKRARQMKEVAGSQMGKAIHKVKNTKAESSHADALNVSSDEETIDSMSSSFVKTKVSSSSKDSQHFSRLKLIQDIAVHVGAVWSMKFSHCGRLLATAGQNNVIWVWVLKDYYAFFNDLRNKYDSKERGAVFATPPRNSMEPPSVEGDKRHSRIGSEAGGTIYSGSDEAEDEEDAPFRSLPFSSYVGHTADVLDLAWSKNYFTLSSSMDKTVRLWHVSQKECLCCFQHIDFVTAISFHPRDDRYFLSGSLDSKLRLWNIPEKKVALWNEVPPDSSSGGSSTSGGALITTVNFCENGKFAVCGTYDGRCLFYDTEHLKYHTQIHVRSSRRRNNKGHKITGIEPLTGEHKILVTSNDSRVRLYDLRDLSLTCKFKGLTNLSSQIKASFSHDNKYIICGSEDKCVYIWKTNPPQDVTKLSSFRRDRNDAWESLRAHDAVVTCAIFAPYPHLMVRSNDKAESGSRMSLRSSKKTSPASHIFIISADFNGVIKIFSNS